MSTARMPALAAVCVGFLWLCSSAGAAVINIVASADGEATVIGGVPVNSSTGQLTNVSQNIVANQALRSLYEFDLPVLADPITSATFVGSVVQNSSPPAVLSFYGFAGDGAIQTADASRTSMLIGSITLPSQVPTGQSINFEVPLTTAFVQALGSDFLGIVTTVNDNPENVLVASLESTLGIRPTLRLETTPVSGPGPGPTPGPGPEPTPGTVPEPATTLLVVTAGMLSLVRRNRRAAG